MQFGIFKWYGVKRRIAMKINKSDKVFLNSQKGDFLLSFFFLKLHFRKESLFPEKQSPQKPLWVSVPAVPSPRRGWCCFRMGRTPPHADVAPLTFHSPS